MNLPDLEGQTPLHLACSGAHLKCIVFLLSHDAKSDAKNSVRAGSVPPGGRLKLIAILPSQLGWRPLHYAASLGHLDAIKLLVVAGADVNAQTNVSAPSTAGAPADCFLCSS